MLTFSHQILNDYLKNKQIKVNALIFQINNIHLLNCDIRPEWAKRIGKYINDGGKVSFVFCNIEMPALQALVTTFDNKLVSIKSNAMVPHKEQFCANFKKIYVVNTQSENLSPTIYTFHCFSPKLCLIIDDWKLLSIDNRTYISDYIYRNVTYEHR